MRLNMFLAVMVVPALALESGARPRPQSSPVPQSKTITGITWDSKANINRQAKGGDNWPTTWADDGNLYTAYGDGNGFDPKVPNKLSLGFCKVTGSPPNHAGSNIRSATGEDTGDGRRGKKASGMLMVDSTLYMWVRNADKNGKESQLAWSTDHAKTWTWSSWRFSEFGYLTFINYGKNYAGARDNYVYCVTHDNPSAYTEADRFILLRVPKGQIKTKSAYEFFKGLDGNGNPTWTSSISQRGAVFTHAGRCKRSGFSYNAGLKRYLWWQVYPDGSDTRFSGGFGVYDAPEPWGPWTTVFFTTNWDVGPGETGHFPPKWMSADGKTIHLVFSGDDYFSVRKATLQTSSSSNAPPSVDITQPTAGQTFTAPAGVTINASASDDGQVIDVEFLVDGTLVGSDSSSPYSYTWNISVSGMYSLTARATDDQGARTTSSPVSITVVDPAPQPPSAPSGLSASAASSTRINLSWTDNSSNESNFELQRQDPGGAFSPLATLGANTTTYSDTSVLPGSSYSYRVRATNGAGNSAWSNVATASTPPSSGGGSGIITNLSPPMYSVGTLAQGELQYGDRTYTFSTVPTAYAGMDYLLTLNDDKNSQGFPWITFDVTVDVTVYVAHDDRIAPKPSWMAGFVDTGDDLVSGGGTFSLYAKDFPPGTISLGGNHDPGTSGSSMYTVVVGPPSGSSTTDSDGDGLTDVDELNLYGTNPQVADTDGDGTDDGTEVAQGTDPLDPASFPGSGGGSGGGGGSNGSSSGSGCGATGTEFLLLLGLLVLGKRRRAA